jgi:hypothetical protein
MPCQDAEARAGRLSVVSSPRRPRSQRRCAAPDGHPYPDADSSRTANLDAALQSYLRLYFPKEVKQKAKENERESAKEQLAEMGMDTRCVVQ